jgi:hypothetical protein
LDYGGFVVGALTRSGEDRDMSNLQEHFRAATPARDRRLQTRTTPASLTYIGLGDTNGGFVLNINETGMAVAVANHLVVGEYLPRIRFQLPRSSQSIEISAQLVWLAESKKTAGIRFVNLSADARNQISNWIAPEKPASEFEQLPRPLRSDKQALEISSRKSRRIFSNPSDHDEEAAARYAQMFPTESTYAKHTAAVDEIKPQPGPLPILAGTHTDAGISMFGSAAEISTGDIPQSLAASFPSEHAKNLAPEPIKTFIPELSEDLTPEPVGILIPATLENFPTEPIECFSPDRVQTSSPEPIARTATQASEVVAPEILDASGLSPVEDLQEKVHHYIPVLRFGQQVPTGKIESSPDPMDDSPSYLNVPELSAGRGFGFQLAAVAFLFAVMVFAVGLTGGRGPLGKRLRDPQKSMLAVDATSPALPDRPDEVTSGTSTLPAADTFNTPAVNPSVQETEESRSESPSAPSRNAQLADSATRVRQNGPSSAATSRSNIDSDNSSGVNKLDDATPSEENSKENTRYSESFANVPSRDLNSSPTIESKPSANPISNPESNGSNGLTARNTSPLASSEPAYSAKAVGPMSAAPINSASGPTTDSRQDEKAISGHGEKPSPVVKQSPEVLPPIVTPRDESQNQVASPAQPANEETNKSEVRADGSQPRSTNGTTRSEDHPSLLQFEAGVRLFIRVTSMTRQPDGSFSFRGTLLQPITLAGRVSLDQSTELVGSGTVNGGHVAVSVAGFTVRGENYGLRQAASGVIRKPGSGPVVELSLGKVLEMWLVTASVYEKTRPTGLKSQVATLPTNGR